MRRLSEEEIVGIEETISKVGGDQAAAACVYGSQIAGYAKPNSDYDVLLIRDGYAQKVRYKYLKGRRNVSALIVDTASFLSDSKKASLGEFVAGRLLNVYEPLVGSQLIKTAEIDYKGRVVLETLAEIASLYNGFATVLTIPMEYFLFEKLRRRASIYPPALYSYAQHYSGEEGKSNLAWAKAGFRLACKSFANEKILEVRGNVVKLRPDAVKSRILAKFERTASTTTRAVAQYAVHGYAGRVSPTVIGREVLWKLSRTRESLETPALLKHPKSLWRLKEAVLIVDSNNWLLDLFTVLDYDHDVKFHEISPSEIYSSSSIYEFERKEKVERIVVKKFRDFKSMKWALLGLWALPSRRFNMTPLARMYREFVALTTVRKAGVATPEVVALFLNDRIMVTRYVEGIDLARLLNNLLGGRSSNFLPFETYGECLAKVHRFGYALGDTKPSNTILSDRGLVLTDLEQATPGGDMAWDVAEFLYYASKFTLNVDVAKLVAQYFCSGYLRRGEAEVVRKALSFKYQAPFRPFIAIGVHRAVRKEIQDALVAYA